MLRFNELSSFILKGIQNNSDCETIIAKENAN